MATQVLTNTAASISEFKANPMKAALSGNGEPVAVLNRNETAFYCLPAKTFEAIADALEDAELASIIASRANEDTVMVNLDDL